MKPEVKEKWLKALRSGEYKQTSGYLKDENGYCCLGVLCEIHSKESNGKYSFSEGHKEIHGVEFKTFKYLSSNTVLPKEVQEWAGLDKENPVPSDRYSSLAELNDQGNSFLEIADIIEKK